MLALLQKQKPVLFSTPLVIVFILARALLSDDRIFNKAPSHETKKCGMRAAPDHINTQN